MGNSNAVHKAIYSNDFKTAETLIENRGYLGRARGIVLDTTYKGKITALFVTAYCICKCTDNATYNSLIQIMKQLLGRNIDPSENSILVNGAKMNAVQYLLLYNPRTIEPVQLVQGKVTTGLFRYACLHSSPEMLKFVIDTSSISDSEYIWALLYLCRRPTQNRYYSCIESLIEKKTDIGVNHRDCGGNSALLYACKESTNEIVNLLIEHGADLIRINHQDRTPLILACSNRAITTTTIQRLLDGKVPVNLKDTKGNTALMNICRRSVTTIEEFTNKKRIIQLLIRYGATVDNECLTLACKTHVFDISILQILTEQIRMA